MWVIKENIKIVLLRILFRIFWLIPLKNQIFFSSYEGKQISGNPKSLFNKINISEKLKKYIFVWESNNDKNNTLNSDRVTYVKHNSLEYILNILTSKIIITNSGLNPIFPLRKKQIYVNTWHGGGAYKRVGKAVNQKINGSTYYSLKIASDQTNYFISSSEVFSTIMAASVMIDKSKFLPIGMPRNDIFFNESETKYYYDFVRKNLNLEEDIKIALFAPTFRNDESKKIENLDFKELINSLQQRFGGNWIFLYRGHYHSNGDIAKDSCMDVSAYPDMQELLCASDVLITDYSSSIWDFSFLKRPCFLYVPDLKDYENERNFYTDINDWPGIIIENNSKINEIVSKFDYKIFFDKIEKHHKQLHSYENGVATQRFVELLERMEDEN